MTLRKPESKMFHETLMSAHNLPRAKMTIPIGYCSRYLLMHTFFPGCGGLIFPIRIGFRYSVIKIKIMSKWVETKVEILGKSTTLKYLINEYTGLTIAMLRAQHCNS